ncbi:translation initiation factor IF-1 [Candidatus Gracilibacteria bacterium]|nr:translation initiation factor IF-1 [Candidatus Gracilibacteria bacterium]
MSKDDKIEVEGKILKSLPGAIFEVQLPEEFSNMVIRAYVSGKMQKHLIRLIPGDTVTVELTPYDLSRGRITFRKPNANAPVRTPGSTPYRR